MFQDIVMFGRISTPRAWWSKAPYQPTVNTAIVRGFKSRGAVAPETGRLDYMISDQMNTDNMNKYLRQISRSRWNRFIVMIVDRASSHKAKALKIPGNMALIFLSAIQLN
jgi:hypothetical protein